MKLQFGEVPMTTQFVIGFGRVPSLAIKTVFAAAFGLMIGCGGATTPTGPTTTTPPTPQVRVLLDVSGVDVPGPQGCNVSSTPQEFTGQAGTTVTIEVTGPSAMTPSITVYAPDFATQLTGTTTSGPGMQTMTTTTTENGPYRVNVCASNSVGGSVRIRVTTRA
jgi:hypothetical protein